MRVPALLLSAVTFLLAACGGGSDATGPGDTFACTVSPPSGTVTATVNGTPFSATLTAQATIQNDRVNGANVIQVNGVSCPARAGEAPRQILFTIGRITPITPGTYQLDSASQLKPPQSGYSGIGLVAVAPSLWYSNLRDATGPGSGSITFTTITATRLTGTFQMVGVPAQSNGTSARDRVTITNGVFDVTVP